MEISHKYLTEKWQHAGFQKYFRNTGWMFSTRIITMLLGFGVTAIVARHLGPLNYGSLSYALSFVGLFSFIANLGIDNVLYRDLIKYPDREHSIVGTALILKIISGIITTGIIILTLFIIPEEPALRLLIVIASVSYIFQAFNVINYTFQARVHAKYTSIISLFVVIILSVIKISIVYWGKGMFYFGIAYTIEPFLYGLFYILYYKKLYGNPFDWHFKGDIAWEILRESLPLIVSSVFVIIYSRIDQIMIRYMIDITSVGLYDAAVRLSEVWYFLPGIIVSSVYPSIVNAHGTDEKIYARRLMYLTLFLIAISAGIGLFVTVFAKWIMLIAFGNKFIGGYSSLQFYVWSGIGISIGTVLNQYLITEKLTSHLLYISIIGMLLNVALNLLLIPQYGISGSAFATLISYILGPLSIICFPKVRRRILRLIQV